MTRPEQPRPPAVAPIPPTAVTVAPTMEQTPRRTASAGPSGERPERDRLPESAMWNVPAYLLAGMAGYAFLGWLLDRWLGTSFLVAVGLLAGTGLAIYTIWVRYGRGAAPGLAESLPDHDADPQLPNRRSEEML